MISHDITAHNTLPMFATLYMQSFVYNTVHVHYTCMYHFPYTCANINVAIIKVPFQASACVITSYICIIMILQRLNMYIYRVLLIGQS